MRLLSSLVIAILLTSCVTQQRCLEKFPPMVHDSIIVRDSIVMVHDSILVPYQELTFSDEVPCPDVVYSKTVTKGSLTGSVNINKGVVTVKFVDDSLRLVIDRPEKSKTVTRTIVREPKPIIEYQTKWYHTASLWINLIILLVILLDLARTFYRLRK